MSEPRKCVVCNGDIVRTVFASGRLEGLHKFTKRQFCSHKCSHEAKRKPEALKTCAHCGGPIKRLQRSDGKLEQYSTYARRKYCCLGHAKAANLIKYGIKTTRTTVLSKVCPNCEQQFFQRERETPSHFRRKTYCSTRCGSIGGRSYVRENGVPLQQTMTAANDVKIIERAPLVWPEYDDDPSAYGVGVAVTIRKRAPIAMPQRRRISWT